DTTHFFGVEIQLWRIGQSLPAPRFNIVVRPNDWVEAVQRAGRGALSETQQLRLQFWQGFHRYLAEHGVAARVSSPRPDTWVTTAAGRSNFAIGLVASNYDLDGRAQVPGLVTRLELVITGPRADDYF